MEPNCFKGLFFCSIGLEAFIQKEETESCYAQDAKCQTKLNQPMGIILWHTEMLGSAVARDGNCEPVLVESNIFNMLLRDGVDSQTTQWETNEN